MKGWRIGPFRALDHRFFVEGVTSDPVAARLQHALSPLATVSTNEPVARYCLEPVRGPSASSRDLYRVKFEERVIRSRQAPFYAAAYVLWHVNQRAVVRDRGRHLMLHAAGVARDGVLVVILGASGAGKTTTAAGLLRAGFEYLTDEVVALDRTTFAASAFPKALALNADVGHLVLDPQILAPPERVEAVHDVPWWELGSPGVVDGVTPSLIVSLVNERQAAGRLAGESWRMAPGEAVLALAGSTFRMASRRSRNLEGAVALAASVPAVALVPGDLAASVAQISRWVDQLSAGAPPEPSGDWRPQRPGVRRRGGNSQALPDPGDAFAPAPGVRTSRSGPDLVVGLSGSLGLTSLSGTAPHVWHLLDGRASLREVAHGLACAYDAPEEEVLLDVRALMGDLRELGLVEARTQADRVPCQEGRGAGSLEVRSEDALVYDHLPG